MKKPKAKPRKKTPTCSFCGCGGDTYRVFIEAPKNVHICHKCVALCVEIIVTEHAKLAQCSPKESPND